jgi:flagellar biosynthesis/type III secretory pathway M-ring protein FliF/YscJ
MTNVLLTALAAVTPSPSPSGYDTDQVTPGVVGFVVTAVVALLVILLVLDMVRRVRRVTYRAQIAEDLDAEERERAEAETPGRDPLAPPRADGDGGIR